MDKSMKNKLIGLLVILVVIVVIVTAFVLYNEWPLLTGKKIVLATQPVDPFAPFRGQYMRIGYEISRLEGVEDFESGDVIYVLLDEDEEGIWRFESASHSMPSRGDFIKGKITWVSGESVSVEYGIEQFFFEKGASVPIRNITVEVSVANSGRAGFVQLLQDGKPVDIE